MTLDLVRWQKNPRGLPGNETEECKNRQYTSSKELYYKQEKKRAVLDGHVSGPKEAVR